MKFVSAIILLLLISGCDEKPARDPDPEKKVFVRDSNTVKNGMANPLAPIDVSPMDMAYFPTDFPIQKMAGNTGKLPVARVIYSRPHRQGRTIFGGLLKYGEPWRLGANEATEIELFRDVTIQGKKVQKGRYILYCIPSHRNWTIVFNENPFTWGLRPDPSKDLHKFPIPVMKTPATLEYFTIVFQASVTGADLVMGWENVMGKLPIQL